jgi:Isopenicillin N synthase and related dioxygenases
MDKIPSVDLRDFLSGDPERKQKFVNEIGKAYEEIGFVALKGHFLDDKLVDELYVEVKNFFDLPVETKQKYEIPGIGGQRGYVGFGKETAKGFQKRRSERVLAFSDSICLMILNTNLNILIMLLLTNFLNSMK